MDGSSRGRRTGGRAFKALSGSQRRRTQVRPDFSYEFLSAIALSDAALHPTLDGAA